MLSCLKLMLSSSETVISKASDTVSSAMNELPAPDRGKSWIMTAMLLAFFVLIFYFLLIRPEKKRKKAEQKLRDSMRVGDTVVTIGGITGEIESIREETITIFTGDNSVDIQKWAIRSVLPDKTSDAAEEAESAGKTEKGAESAENADKGAENADKGAESAEDSEGETKKG